MTSTQDPQGLIQQYLNNIRGYGENPFSQQLQGERINCDINTGPSLLCKQHNENEKKFREGEGPIPPYSNPTRYTQSYVGQGAFGIVFSQRLGRPGIPENTFAIKSIHNISPTNLRKEVYFQKLAAGNGIAPNIYDYFICNCDDGPKGFIIMEYLENYVHPGIIQDRLIELAESGKEGERIANYYKANLDQKLEEIKNKLKDLNIGISDFQYLIKLDYTDIKVVDFGGAYHIKNSKWRSTKRYPKSQSSSAQTRARARTRLQNQAQRLLGILTRSRNINGSLNEGGTRKRKKKRKRKYH